MGYARHDTTRRNFTGRFQSINFSIPNDSSYAMRRGIRRKQLYPLPPALVRTPTPAPAHGPAAEGEGEPAPASSAPAPVPEPATNAPTDTGAQYYEKRAARIRRKQLTLDPAAREFVPRSLGLALALSGVEGEVNAEVKWEEDAAGAGPSRLAELKFEQGANTNKDLNASMNQNTNTNAKTSMNTNINKKKKGKKRKKKRTKNGTECTPNPALSQGQLSGEATRGWIDGGGGGDGTGWIDGEGCGDNGGDDDANTNDNAYTDENWAGNWAQNRAGPDDKAYDSDDPIRAWMEPPRAAGVNERVLAWLDEQRS